jgi:hypothetical protein
MAEVERFRTAHGTIGRPRTPKVGSRKKHHRGGKPVTKRALSARKRWSLFVVSAVASVFLFWFPPGREYIGYFLPIVLSINLIIIFGFTFIASRLERSDVTTVERQFRRIFFKRI